MLETDFVIIDFVTYRFRYSIASDLYCCLVIQSEHDALNDIWSWIFYFAHVVVDSGENSGEKSQSGICWKFGRKVLNPYGDHQE